MAVARVRVELLEQRGGLWCGACLQPSRTVYVVAASDGEHMTLTQRERCRFCGPVDPGETHE